MKITEVIVILFFTSLANTAFAQRGSTATSDLPSSPAAVSVPEGTRAFDIFMKDNKIGAYEAHVVNSGAKTKYKAKSESSVRLLGKHTITFSLECTFQDDMLMSSDMISHKNGKLRDHTTVSWTGDGYQITKNGDKSTETDPIRNCNIQLYFSQPKDNMITFSEKEAIYKKIKKTGVKLIQVSKLKDAFPIIVGQTKPGRICLLSPAASSYDQFHNFEHRGDTFKSLARKLIDPKS